MTPAEQKAWIAGRDAAIVACQIEIDRGDKNSSPNYAFGARACRDAIRALTPPAVTEWTPRRASRPPQDGDFVDVNPEAQWLDDMANACPHCGGSGHKDDVTAWTPPPEAERPDGYRCLATVKVVWHEWSGEWVYIGKPTALAPAAGGKL
jgi:hypothetical protein